MMKNPGAAMKITDAQVIASYMSGQSCKAIAKQFSMCAQSVHERVKKLNINRPINTFSGEETARLVKDYDAYVSAGKLSELATELGRTKQFLCRQARALNLTSLFRKKPYLAEKMSVAAKARIAANGHPRGMAGKSHSAMTRKTISEKSRARWKSMTKDQRADMTMAQLKARAAAGTLFTPRRGVSWKSGWREVAGRRIFFRSKWEANYGFYLEWLRTLGYIAKWEHEPHVFWFEKIKRGCRSYLPDFRVTENNGSIVFHEVKGWMDARSKTKINRMRIHYPNVVLAVIDKTQYEHFFEKDHP